MGGRKKKKKSCIVIRSLSDYICNYYAPVMNSL